MSINNEKYVKIRTVTDGLPEEEERRLGGGAVDSVNGKTGDVVLTGKDIKATLTTPEGQSITLSVTDQLQSLANEQDRLNTQVSSIEAIIPSTASDANPLATLEDINSTGASVAAESARAQAAESKLDTDIKNETTRATTAESQLRNDISANTTAIETETERAKTAEEELDSKISDNSSSITAETSRATAAESTLNTKIEAETTRAQGAESAIQSALTVHIEDKENPHEVTKAQVGLGNVDNTSDMDKPVSTAQASAISAAVSAEATARETAIANEASARQTAIAAETTARETAINSLETQINAIEDIIPSSATTTNELADKAFVNSTVQTATANFRGNWQTWADVPTDSADYPVDYAGSKVPTVNDYLVVSDASGFTGETLQGTWRFKYSGVWATDGKAGWLPEYQVNEEPLTMAQLAALNSGVTSELLTTIQQNIATNASGISQLNTDLTQGLSQKADASTVTAQLATKADKSSLESLESTVSDLSTTVSGKADSSSLGTMASKDASNYSTTAQANALYAGKALETTVSGLSTTVSNLSDTVATKANQSDLTALTSTVSTLQTTVGTKADSATVTSQLATKATKATDFITPITDENKGATQTEITELEEKIAKAGKIPMLKREVSTFKFNDVSYLNANTFSWQSGAVYVAAYQHLVDDLSTAGAVQTVTIEGVTISFEVATDGHRICLPTQETAISQLYAKTGEADFYILDTENARFKLPRTQKRKLIRVLKYADGGMAFLYSDGWLEQSGTINCQTNTNTLVNLFVPYQNGGYNVQITYTGGSGTGAVGGSPAAANLKTASTFSIGSQGGYHSWTACGYAADSAIANEPVEYEYYYVGNFEQSSIEQTAGITAETLNQKVDVGHQVIEFQAPTAANGYTWYRKYADGWVEQGGRQTTYTNKPLYNQIDFTFTLPISIQANTGTPQITYRYTGGASGAVISANVGTTSGEVTVQSLSNSMPEGMIYWEVKGMAI